LRGGGGDVVRNLADFFDMTVDQQGRVLVGYANGCVGGPCSQAAATAHGNAYTVSATIARQSSGRRMIATFDLTARTWAPGIPYQLPRLRSRLTASSRSYLLIILPSPSHLQCPGTSPLA